jgi:hypothetical protein
MMRGYSAYEIWLQQGHTGTEEDFLEWLSGQGQIDAKIEEVYETIAREYVRKVIGMGLSQNDFTNILKAKLESLENYDDTQVRALITSLTNRLDTLVDGDVTQAIETFNEVIAFLDGLSDTQSLAEIIASIQSEIATKANAATTYTKTEADTKFATNETVNSAAFLGSESGSSTTANFDAQTDTVWNIPQVLGSAAKAQARENIGAGTYSKPSSGIPASDLAQGVIPDVSGFASKVSNATNGHLAGLDANGNLTDSGFKITTITESDYEALATKDSNTIYLITES